MLNCVMQPIATGDLVAWCVSLSCGCAVQKRLNGSTCLGWRLLEPKAHGMEGWAVRCKV